MRTKLLLALVTLVALYAASPWPSEPVAAGRQGIPITAGNAGSDAAIAHAFENRLSNLQVQGRGRVAKILPDDSDGSRHQRFVLRLRSGRTILVAHNIDLAPRLALDVGDDVEFNGEYEWNAKGGVVHWTHRDPAGHHEDGWLRHGGKTYH